MLFRRFFKRRRTCSSTEASKHLETCFCTTAKRDSMYDDASISWTKQVQRRSADRNDFPRTDKPRRPIRQLNMDEYDRDEDMTITEKLRRASSQCPANIPMLVVVSFKPDSKGVQKKQIEIQRGFPVNAQYILNEWLFIKTADNEEGFVPYLCCRPMLRRTLNKTDSTYKLHDFNFDHPSSRKVNSKIVSSLTPATMKKLSLSNQSYSFTNFTSQKKRTDVTSSSCGGDSGVSDCESSSHHQPTIDLSIKRSDRSTNVRSSCRTLKQTGLTVQDLPLRKITQTNSTSRIDHFHPIKSQLTISTNSAFTKIIKKNSRHDDTQRSPHIRSYQYEQEPSSTSFKKNSSRCDDSYDDTTNLSFLSSQCHVDNTSTISSPYIRRTPFVRRSLPHTNQSIIKKTSYSKSNSSPDPFLKRKDKVTRPLVLLDPPLKPTIGKYFSDLSLNQIENDSLPIPITLRKTHLLVSSSSTSPSTTVSSFNDDPATTPFIHIQMTNYLGERKSIVYPSTTISNTHSNTLASKSTSFIHNVSITV